MQHDWSAAYRLALFADGIFGAIGVPRQPPDQADRERVVREAADRLGSDGEARQREHARAMSWSDVLKIAAEV